MGREAKIDVQDNSIVAIALPGLTSAEARRRREEFGPNAVSEQMPPRWRVFLAKFWGPIPWMLEAAIVLQIALGAYIEAAIIGALLLFNTTLGFFQEGRAGAALVRRREAWRVWRRRVRYHRRRGGMAFRVHC